MFASVTVYPSPRMVKRACPFTDDMNPQVKIHVGQKEVANGVMKDQHMKLIYDKTKDLLFRGAKKSLPTPVAESNSPLNGPGMRPTPSPVSPMKQMRLTSEGLLSKSDDDQVVPLQKIVPCTKCLEWNQSDMRGCSFCDTSLCQSCVQTCLKCQDLFCGSCSFNMYDALEGCICRNCC